ncbi:MAG: RIP metalloprotease RseP [Alphaproteobacteria bacterium]|nr:RIP metalloprotease RseP [Alphaproteobacteria bacterium]
MDWIIHNFFPFIITLTILVFVHELGHFLVARRNDVRVTVFSIGFGPSLFGWNDSKGTRWQFCLIPLGGYVKMFGDADPSSGLADSAIQKLTEKEKKLTLHSKTPLQRIAVAVAGPLANFIFAFVILTGLITVKGVPFLAPTIGFIESGMLADKSGLKTDDKIITLNHQKVDSFEHLRSLIRDNIGNEIALEIDRHGEVIQKTIALYEKNSTTGEITPLKKLGIGPNPPEYCPATVFSAATHSVYIIWDLCVGTLKGLGAMITGQQGAGDLGGILSIGDMAAQSTKGGVALILSFMAMLSVNLGLINLLPIPVLDGGHIFLCSIEALRGKPLSLKMQERIFLVGFLFIASTMLYATWNDLVRYKVFHYIKNWF